MKKLLVLIMLFYPAISFGMPNDCNTSDQKMAKCLNDEHAYYKNTMDKLYLEVIDMINQPRVKRDFITSHEMWLIYAKRFCAFKHTPEENPDWPDQQGRYGWFEETSCLIEKYKEKIKELDDIKNCKSNYCPAERKPNQTLKAQPPAAETPQSGVR